MPGRYLYIVPFLGLFAGCASSDIVEPRPPSTSSSVASASQSSGSLGSMSTGMESTTGSTATTGVHTTVATGSFTNNSVAGFNASTGMASATFGNSGTLGNTSTTFGNTGTGTFGNTGSSSFGGNSVGGSTTGFGNPICTSCVVDTDCRGGLSCNRGVCNTHQCGGPLQVACQQVGGFCASDGSCACPVSNSTTGIAKGSIGGPTSVGPASTTSGSSFATATATSTRGTTTGGPTITGGSTRGASSSAATIGGPSMTAVGTIGSSGSTGQLGSCMPSPGWPGNMQGVGAYCSASSPTCPNGLFCAASAGLPYNFCIQLGCNSDAQCGEDACCFSTFGMSACVPTQCGLCGGTVATSAATSTNGRTIATAVAASSSGRVATATTGRTVTGLSLTTGGSSAATTGGVAATTLTGGTITGGKSTGGTVTGATVTGGTSTSNITGGTVTGGTITGGKSTFNSTLGTGTVTGGTVTGGKVTGGKSTTTVIGGTSTGGTVTGATVTGGTATGGTFTAAGTTGSSGSTGSQLGSCTPSPGWPGNSEGVGAYCNGAAGQCNAFGTGLLCGAQFGYDFCTLTGCSNDAECGEAACCVSQFGVKVCAPTGCGLCPSMSSGSTGVTIGGPASSSAGATSGTSGSTGNPPPDCTTTGCPTGETCTQYTAGGPFYNLCSCTPANPGLSVDTCASNANGHTVCDPDDFQCRLPRDFETCNTPRRGVAACSPGYFCSGGICLQSCKASADCSLTFNSCQAFSSAQSICTPNNCGPGSGPDAGDFYGPCEVSTPGDGFCQPYVYDGGAGGYCYLSGTQGPHQLCGGYASKTLACEANAICYGNGELLPDGGPNETCYETCNASTSPGPNEVDACPTGKTCYAFSAGAGPLQPGSCNP